MPYELVCTGCAFREVVDGEFDDAIEAVEGHLDVHRDDPLSHFVNVHRRG